MNNKNTENLALLARLMDSVIAIPGTNFKIGLDPLIGLIPGVGDGATTLVSLYIVFRAAQLGVPRSVLLRMGVNVLIDTVLGSVPLVGDLFDAAWKANVKNVELIEQYASAPSDTVTLSKRHLFGFLILALLSIGFVIGLGIVVAKGVLSLL